MDTHCFTFRTDRDREGGGERGREGTEIQTVRAQIRKELNNYTAVLLRLLALCG